jgi:hypothetical protein
MSHLTQWPSLVDDGNRCPTSTSLVAQHSDRTSADRHRQTSWRAGSLPQVDRLNMIKLLDAAVGPIKARDRGHTGGRPPLARVPPGYGGNLPSDTYWLVSDLLAVDQRLWCYDPVRPNA